MPIIKTINLTPESEKIREDLFGEEGGNFSGWVQEKLLEAKKEQNDKDYILMKISDANSRIEKVEAERRFWVKKLEHAKKQEDLVIEGENKRNISLNEISVTKFSIQSKIRMWAEYQKLDISEEKLNEFIEEYYNLTEKKGGTINVKEFLLSKLNIQKEEAK